MSATQVVAFEKTSALSDAVRIVENMELAIPHPAQEVEVVKKLAALQKKSGKHPNILWLVVDDMGYGNTH
ncbi:MAG: hypothetical protein ACI8PB_002614 [Desulforhopalus sp.]